MKKVILTDVDGVLLNWEYAFDTWMNEQGFKTVDGEQFVYNMGDRYGIERQQAKKLIKIFNESAVIGFLPPLRDAVQWVTKMADEGWTFHAITSLSTQYHARKLRKQNLDKLFGEGVFTEINCLGTGADKDEALAKYKDSGMWWIEDKVENAQAGAEAGLKPIVIEHGFNMNEKHKFPVAKTWKDVYEIISA
ncbi:MAG: hypothetical protein CMA64_08990 [Euryarchaeota archaeon]|nr:hypothetical protein [Euryarchaeota archaeon]